MNLEILKHVPKRTALRDDNEPIRVVFIGKIRFMEANDEIIRAFGNDKRYIIYFIGAGSESLHHYFSKYNNIVIIGAYSPEETSRYLKDADVINSYFGTKVFGYERMSSIRFSYAPYIHIPVIVGTNTNMEEEGAKYGFAYGFGKCDIDKEADQFYKWYHSIKIDSFIDGCERYCSDVEKTDREFYQVLSEVCKD